MQKNIKTRMNPLNTQQQQHLPTSTQYYIAGMPPLTSSTSILKTNVSGTVSTANQQPTVVTTLNNIGSGLKVSANGNSIIDTSKFVTTATNYLPVLLTNQTLISNVDPIKQQQHPPTMLSLGSIAAATSTCNANIPLLSGSKPMVLSSTNSAAGNITYQVLSTSQNNNLAPVIAAPNGTVSVLLTSSQPMATAGHVAAPIIIRNTPTVATTTKAVQIKQQTQLPARQQQMLHHQQQHLQTSLINNNNNPPALNAEIVKQIVVGNTVSPAASTVAAGTTLLKPSILQNKQQKTPQQIPNKAVAKNTKMIITPPQQQQHLQLQQNVDNHTIVTTTSENSSQIFAALGMELVKAPNAAQTVQKLPQISLLQNSTKKSSNITEIISESAAVELKNPNEIKVGNVSSEVSLIKKPNISPTEIKSKESSILKASNSLQSEIGQIRSQDSCNTFKMNTKTNYKEFCTAKESNESLSLLKPCQDLKVTVSEAGNNITHKSSNVHVEKQKSLLKPKICYKKTTETERSSKVKDEQRLTSPRSQRSNSYNTSRKSPEMTSKANNERRHSEPSKIESETVEETRESCNKIHQRQEATKLINSQELEVFFEDEEYLESLGDKSSVGSIKPHSDNTQYPARHETNKKIIETPAIRKSELEYFSEPKKIGKINRIGLQEKCKKKQERPQDQDTLDAGIKIKSMEDINDEANSSENDDDDVTILPNEEIEIEQIEIDDDDDDDDADVHYDEKVITYTNSGTFPLADKEQRFNESLLCDEQFLISSSSSISNNSSDQNSVKTSLIKSPQTDNTITPLLKKTLMEPKLFNKKEEPQSNGYSSVLDILSTFNMLSWRERIGSARGTTLKFQLNEFNLIQLYESCSSHKRIHTAYEKPIYERESSRKRNENSEPPTYYMCRRCSVQGPSVDFLAPEFCSLSCLKRDCRKRRDDASSSVQKRNRVNNNKNLLNNIYNKSANDNQVADINNPPPLTYIRKPKFRWTNYMNRNYNVIAAPISLFLNPFPTGPNNFLVGMKLEAIDPENCALFCICTVISIMGYRLKLSFDGYSSAYDFWLNADSMDIFPPGWCAKTNRVLQPPKGIAVNKFNWGAYLNKEKALPAPRYLFTHLNSSSLVPHNPFKIGMHLEAEDLNDTGKLCVASVADVLDDRIRIHFDGWDDCYDIIVDINSPYIHPCGWHEGRQQLVVPPDCENSAFNWNDYIRQQGTGEAAGEELFAPREPIDFKPNMRLEVVDPRNPSLIRPATVISHKGHRVKLHLDGWPSDYCFWLEDDSPDLHPIGWCDATGHDLEPPPGFQISKQKMPCPVDGCRGIGNAKHAFKCFHATRDGCPYAAENWRTVVEKPPRVEYDDIVKIVPKPGKYAVAQQVASLKSRLNEQQILERIQMLDSIKTRNVIVQHEKLPSNQNDLFSGLPLPDLKVEDIKETKLPKMINPTSTSPSTSSNQIQNSDKEFLDVNIDIAREFLCDYGPRLQQNFTLWQKNFSFDTEKIKRNPLKWSTTEVSVFIDLYLNCRQTATLFSHEDIDGEAFLLLQQQDLTERLGLKLGPAVKLYTCILQLRTLAVAKFNVAYKSLSLNK